MRVRCNAPHLRQCHAGSHHQVEPHGDGNLVDDDQPVTNREFIERDRYRALDGVLDRNKRSINGSRANSIKGSLHGDRRDEFVSGCVHQ